jgi:ADP-ribosylglycohydrolase
MFFFYNAMQWRNVAIGNNTRNTLLGVNTVAGYLNRWKKFKIENPDPTKWTESNGALMRCWPLALIENDQQRRNAVAQDCSITNANPICISVNQVYITIVHKLIYNKPIVESDFEEHLYTYKNALKNGVNGRNVTINKGQCLNSLYCAFVALCFPDSKPYNESIAAIIGK